MNKISRLSLALIIHVVTSLFSSIEKRPKLMALKILMCSEPNKAIMHQLLERFLKSPCPYLCIIK